MNILENVFDCVGCGACCSVCKTTSITMKPLEGGFLYPIIDENSCVNCNLCKNVCPVLAEKKQVLPIESFACFDTDHMSRSKSASGGVSNLLAERFIKDGGGFCGVKLNDELKAVHDITFSLDDLDIYRDSKYVQSNMSLVWSKLQSALSEGKKVLVTGTPCQIAAVKQRFKGNDNLFTVDLICSGVPDPHLFKLYIEDIQKEYGKAVKRFYFRDKTNGWKNSNVKILFEDFDEKIIERKDSWYFKLFGSNAFFRRACHNCNFKNFNTSADITIGDYWGIEKINPNIDDNGCSVVIVNTLKGKQMLQQILESCNVFETDIQFAIDTHPKLLKSIPLGKYRFLLYNKKYSDKNIRKMIKCCIGNNFTDKVKRKIYSLVKKGE